MNKLQKMEGELSQKQKEQLGEVNLAFSGVEPVVRGISHWAEDANQAVALHSKVVQLLKVQSELVQHMDKKINTLEMQLHVVNTRVIALEKARENDACEREKAKQLFQLAVPVFMQMAQHFEPELIEQFGLQVVLDAFTKEAISLEPTDRL